MNENQHLQYSILKFLKEAEDDVNITSGTLQKRFKLSVETFNELAFQLRNQRLIGKRDNGNWEILDDGEGRLDYYKKIIPEKDTKNKQRKQTNFLSSFTNPWLVTTIGVTLTGTLSIGYYFGMEKVNMENVDLKMKIERLELEKAKLNFEREKKNQ